LRRADASRGATSVETPYGWAVVAASTALVAVAFGANYIVVVGLKPIAEEFGWPRSIPSLAYSLSLFGSGLGGIAMGWLADRIGIFRPVLLGAAMVGLGAVAAAQSQGALTLLLSYGVQVGLLGNSTVFAPLLTSATRWFDRRRGVAVSLVASGQSIAGFVWPSIFRWSIEQYGWRATMTAFGIFAVSAMLPIAFVLRRPPPASPAGRAAEGAPDAAGRVLGLAPNLVLVLLFLAIIGCCVAMAMPMVHIVAYCSDLGFAAARGAEMLSLLLGAAVISRLLFGGLADRIGALPTLLISSSLQAVAMALYAWVDTLLGLYALSLGFGLVFGGIVPSYALAVRELFPAAEAGWRIGVVFLGGTIGMALGGWLGGAIFDLTGAYHAAFLTGFVFNLANLVLVVQLVWRHRGGPTRFVAPAAA
jgi:MFS family permease